MRTVHVWKTSLVSKFSLKYLYLCFEFATLFSAKVIRGALTNGRDWIFLLLKFNDNYDGASYTHSGVIRLTRNRGPNGTDIILEPSADVIAGILLHWVSLILLCGKDLFVYCAIRLPTAFQTLEPMIGSKSMCIQMNNHLNPLTVKYEILILRESILSTECVARSHSGAGIFSIHQAIGLLLQLYNTRRSS